VSVITALSAVIPPLELSQEYDVLPIYIAKNGNWYAGQKFKDIGLYTSGKISDVCQKQPPVALLAHNGLKLVRLGSKKPLASIDIMFPALHGTHGEDGEVMAVCQLANVPCVGCDMAASAAAMDKVTTKLLAQAAGVDVTPAHYFKDSDYQQDPDAWITKINRALHYPLFVKPAHLGSSIGISRVKDPKDLRDAIEVALHYDDKALVEQAVPNLIEVTLPIMGNDDPRPALLERPFTSAENFLDFDSKYMHGGKKGKTGDAATKGSQGYSEIPADLPKDLYKKAENTGLSVYRALGCSGTARVDMLIDSQSGNVYCNEVNPLPGSLYAHNWSKAGISGVELVQHLIGFARERHEQQSKLERAFSTNYLKQF
jgi:D-alanine-D-alanine ligase